MGSSFQMPEFNFRLRRALNPFESRISPAQSQYKSSPWNVSFDNPQQDGEEGDLPDLAMGRIPDFSRFYDEEGPAIGKYKSYLDRAPRPESYAPSKWRRLGAILSGIGAGGDKGYETARSIIRDPYETAYEDWERSGRGLKEAATMEEATARNRASTYQKMMGDYLEQRKWQMDYEIRMRNARTQEEANQIRAEYNQAMAGIGQRRNDVLEGNSKRSAGAAFAGIKSRQDIAEQDMFHDSIQRGLDRGSRETIATTRGDTGVSGSEQSGIEQQSLRNAVAEIEALGEDATKYFMQSGNYLIPIRALPPEVARRHQARIALGQQTAIGRGR